MQEIAITSIGRLPGSDIKKIETNMFIANNSCEVFLESIELKSLNQIAICLKCKSGFSTQVRVNDMAIFIGDETLQFLYGQNDMMIHLIKLQLQKIIIGSMLLCY